MLNIGNQRVASLAYYDDSNVKRLVREMRVAMADGRLRLVYSTGVFLIVKPDTIWVTDFGEINVKSNTDWIIF